MNMFKNIINIKELFLTIKLPEQETQNLINSINEASHNTIDNLREITNKSITSVSESAEQANNTLNKLANEAKQSLNHSFSDTANNLNQITDKAVGAIADKAKQTEDLIINKSQTLVTSVEDNFQKVEKIGTTISTEIEKSINSLFNHQLDNIQHWIDVHPTISWMLKFILWSINHPLFGLITILVLLFSIWQLFKVFGRLIENGLLVTLTAPFKLVASLLKFNFQPLSFLGSNPQDTLKSEDKQDRLSQLLSRLETLKQEQNNIIQEISTLVSANK